MKREERKNRFTLTLLFSALVFLFLLITMFIIVAAIIILLKLGILEVGPVAPSNSFLIAVGVFSIVVGTVLAMVAGKYPLKPLNKVLNAMNSLADGNFKTRLDFKGPIAKMPVSAEIIDSFNTMASELENTEMLRSDFINNFSHEFKTPIVSIAGFAKLLNHGNISDAERTEYLKIIEDEALRLSSMATNMLCLSKVENQTILTDISTYNLSEQIRKCVLLLEAKWSEKNIDLRLVFDEIDISANEELLKEVWINLIDNAIKFTPYYGTVQIKALDNFDRICISIMNTGNKIPEEIRDKIFSKFYQGDESHSSEGNGIGLAVVKRIIQLHNGTIDVESDDVTTTFTVNIPISRQTN